MSLQTGQSLLADVPVVAEQKPAQLTKQTSTSRIVSTTSQSLMTEPVGSSSEPRKQSQETIKVSKRTDGSHDVIEIATKNVPSAVEARPINPDDIVVDMKYRDAEIQRSATSELNIQHAAPQSFETVLVEPDDVTTEVVVDADGTKRIIVRKLRRTVVTSSETSQQRVTALATAVGDASPTVQAFSEATMRGQQVTVTRTRPDGTVETATRQTYGGRVTTGAPGDQINVEEFEAPPRYTHSVIHGEIGDVAGAIVQPGQEFTIDEGGYTTKTSSVHATVQQVTRRVIRKTRRIIRKVTIIDGKETTTEEVIEEPEEVEINEEDIPHISINVVKREDGREIAQALGVETGIAESAAQPGSPLQGPFFGPFAKETLVSGSGKDSPVTDSMGKSETPEITHAETPSGSEGIERSSEYPVVEVEKSKSHTTDKHGRECFPVEVNAGEAIGQSSLTSQSLIDAERHAVLQTPAEELSRADTIVETSLESAKESEGAARIDDARATCKSDVVPVVGENVEVERGTVEVEQHKEHSRTVEDNDKQEAVVLLEEDDVCDAKGYTSVEDSGTSTGRDNGEASKTPAREGIIAPEESSEDSTPPAAQRPVQSSDSDEFLNGERRHGESLPEGEATKPDQKSVMDKVEISLSVEQRGTDAGSSVSMVTQARQPETTRVHHIVKEDLDIRLPADKEIVQRINDKIVQTGDFITAEKETGTSLVYEYEPRAPLTHDKETETCVFRSDKSDTDSASGSARSRRKKKRRERTESGEKTPIDEDIASGSSLATSIAESTDLNIPLSDSTKQPSEQPQPDVMVITDDSSLTISMRRDDSPNEESGYEPDRPSTLEEPPKMEKPDDSAKRKKKKKTKKQQKVRSTREDDGEVSAVPRSTPSEEPEVPTDEEAMPIPQPEESPKEIVEEDEPEQKPKAGEESIQRVEAITQTTVETRDASAGNLTPEEPEIVDSSLQTSPELTIETHEQQIQTTTAEDVNTEVQTSPTPALDYGMQTTAVKSPEREHSSMQTESPVPAATTEGAVQTSPLGSPPVPSPIEAPKEVTEIQVQTNQIMVDSTHVQTSPIEAIPTSEIETQTLKEPETSLDMEQQTTPPPEVVEVERQESSMQTSPEEVVQTAETDVQTSKAPSPEAPKMENFEIQTDIVEEISLGTSETQTTPPPPPEEIKFEESSMQTDLPEVAVTNETDVQTSKPASPVIPATENFEMQANLVDEVPIDTTETQTTPRESPREIETQEIEIQTRSPEPTVETVMQTSPIASPERAKLAELSAQTSVEETAVTTEEESQTIVPEKIETLDSFAQIETEELVPTAEESAQIIPDTADISSQTGPGEEKSVASVSQQTIVQSVETSTMPDPELAIKQVVEQPMEIEVVKETPIEIEVVEQPPIEMEVVKQPPTEMEVVKEPPIEVQMVEDQPLPEKTEPEEPPVTIEPPKAPSKLQMEPQPEHQERPLSVASERDSTPDTSYEIHVRATVELCGSSTADSSLVTQSESTEPTQTSSSTVTEEPIDLRPSDETTERSVKRHKRKRKHKHTEVSAFTSTEREPRDDRDSIHAHPAQSSEAYLRLSYSEVAKKNASYSQPHGHQSSEPQSGDENVPDNVTIGRVFTDLRLSDVKHREKPGRETPQAPNTHAVGRVDAVPEIPVDDISRDTEVIVGARVTVQTSHDIDNANAPPRGFALAQMPKKVTSKIPASSVFPEAIRIETTPEPMDTSEEPLSPMESVLTQDSRPERKKHHEIKSYAEAIAESDTTKKMPMAKKPEYESDSWDDRGILGLQTMTPTTPGATTSGNLIVAETRDFVVKPMAQRTQSTRMVSERLTNLPSAKETSHLSNILHVATLEDVQTAKPVEERASEIRKELAQLRNAVAEENIVVVEESIITIVETISTWLETIEYRIFLGRESPAGPSHDDSRTFVDLRDEVNHVEGSIRELDEIWTQLEGKYPEEERERIRECMDALEHQVRAIEDVTSDGERYTNAELARWDEFINGVNNVYR